MPHERINPSSLFTPPRYSLIVGTVGRRQWHMSAIGPRGADGAVVGRGEMRMQAEAVVENLRRVLEGVGARPDQVARINPYTTDMDRFRAEATPALYGFFDACRPASTLIGVRRLSHPDHLLEVELTAVDDEPGGAIRPHERLDLPAVYPVPGDEHSQVVVSSGQRQRHLAGLVAHDRERRLIGEGDMRAQAERIMENLRLGLEAVGAGLDDVVRLNVVTTDIERFDAEARPLVFGPFADASPAATVVEVNRLAGPKLLLEIEATSVDQRGAAVALGPHGRLNPPALYPPGGRRYTHVITSSGMRQWHFAGVVSQRFHADTDTWQVLGEGDMHRQTEGTIESLRLLLEAVGATAQQVVRINLFTTDVERYIAEGSLLLGAFFGGQPPASTLVEIERLAHPRLLIELEATAIDDQL